MNDFLALFKDKETVRYVFAGLILFTVVCAIFKKPLIELFTTGFEAYLKWKQSSNTELIAKQDEIIKLVKMLINGNTKAQKEFQDKLDKAVTKKDVEQVIYNTIQFLELKQNKE